MAVSTELAFAGETPAPTTIRKSPQRLRTVVVDDSATFLQVTCHLLDLEEVIDLVAAASDGVEAIDIVMRVKPDLVLMDVNMPGLDGLSAASIFARMSPAPTVLLMSSEDTIEVRAACLRAGAFDFVPKENFRKELETMLRRVFEMRQERQVHERNQTEISAGPISPSQQVRQ